MYKIAISGANGFVGKNVARFLAANGFETISIVRKGRTSFGKTLLTKDLTEKNLANHIKGSVAFLHLVGAGRQTVGNDYETVNVTLTRNAVALCKKAGIGKIIYLSGLGVDKRSTLGYFISKYKAEQEIIQSGLDYTIFRPSYMMGRGDPLTKMLSTQMALGTVVIPGSGKYGLQPISVHDVARVVSSAVSGRQFSRKIIDLVGPKTITYNRLVRDLVGKTKIRHVDFEKAYHDALIGRSPFSVDDLAIIVGGYLGNHRKLASLSGIVFTKYDKMLEACGLA